MADFQLGTLGIAPTISSNFVGDSDTSDTYSFRLGSASNLNVALTGLSADADLRIVRDTNSNGLIDAGETEIASSRFGSNLDDSINRANIAAGDYIAEVFRFSSNNTKYDLRLSATGSSGSNPSNLLPTETEVGNLSGTRTFTDTVNDTDTADVYHFSLNRTSNLRVSLTGLSADADIRLIRDNNSNLTIDPNSLSASGEVIAVSRLGGSANELITFNNLAAGENYYVQVAQFSGNTNYTLSLSA